LKKIKNGFKRKPRLGTEKYLKKYHAEGFRKVAVELQKKM
jgi:hypothetical protein